MSRSEREAVGSNPNPATIRDYPVIRFVKGGDEVKILCSLKRFVALFAVIFLSFAFPLSALAASDSEADMPSRADFASHRGSWFVWRKRSLPLGNYYELCASPVSFSTDGAVSSGSYNFVSPSYHDVSVLTGSTDTIYYACALPVPIPGVSGSWSELPSFPVGCHGWRELSCFVSLYGVSSNLPNDYSVFLSPSYSGSTLVYSTGSEGSASDSITSAEFPSPLYSFPFAVRADSPSTSTSYVVQGGDSSCINTSHDSNSFLSFKTNKFLIDSENFSSYPYSYVCSSRDIGLVVIKSPSIPAGGTVNSASLFRPDKFNLTATLLVPASMLPDAELGDWLSRGNSDKLQDDIVDQFGIDSGTLKDSKNSFNSWSSTSSVDTEIASSASGLLSALFQNLGTFLFSVSLLCFGAVVIRMLIRKAVE